MDVVVVGGGAMGLATAWRLARRGVEVVVLEQFERGHTMGSSHGGSRIFRLAYAEPYYVALALEALPLWRELEDECGGDTVLELTGGVDHGDPAAVEGVASALEGAGRTVERLHPEAAAERWPGLRFEGTVVHSPDSGRVLADRAVGALHRRVLDLGGEVRFAAPVRAIDGARRTVTTDDRSITARHAVVVTAGAWLPALGLHPGPFTVTREQYAHFPTRDDGGWPSFIHYGEPWARYGLLTPGEGLKVGEHHAGSTAQRTVDPDVAGAPDPAVTARIAAYARQWLPGVEPVPATEATCLYTNTPDSSFVLVRTPDDVVVGSACSGHGFKFTPAIGERLAALAVAH